MKNNTMITTIALIGVMCIVLWAEYTFMSISEPVVSAGFNSAIVQLVQILADASVISECIRFEQIYNIKPELTVDQKYLDILNTDDFLKQWKQYLQDTHANYVYFITNYKNANPDTLRPKLVSTINAIVNSKKSEQGKMLDIVLEFNGTSPYDKLSFPGSSYVSAFSNANGIMEKKVVGILPQLKMYVKKNT